MIDPVLIADAVADLLAHHGLERSVERGRVLTRDVAEIAECALCARAVLGSLKREAKMPSFARIETYYLTESGGITHDRHKDVSVEQTRVVEAENWWRTTALGVIRSAANLPRNRASWVAAQIWGNVTVDGSPTCPVDPRCVAVEVEPGAIWLSVVPEIVTDEELERVWSLARHVNTRAPRDHSDEGWKALIA